jgi:hypothetical protein
MTKSFSAQILCVLLSFMIASPPAFAQASQTPVAPPLPPANAGNRPLTIGILVGNKTVNSLPLLRSVSPVVEIRDQDDFPVEGATVTFTLPSQGPGGTFVAGNTSFDARTDARGQAAAPAFVPRGAGRFEIKVSATLGARKGEGVITQTNSSLAQVGSEIVQRPWYKKKLVWLVAGGAAAAITIILVTTGGGSSSKTITITPGTPVFQ